MKQKISIIPMAIAISISLLIALPIGFLMQKREKNKIPAMSMESWEFKKLRDSAEIAYNDGDFDRAISSYEEALRLRPDNAEIYNNLGATYYQIAIAEFDETSEKPAQRLTKARDLYATAIDLNPRYAPAYRNLGVLYLKLGKTELAIDALEKTHKLEPNDKKLAQYIDRLK